MKVLVLFAITVSTAYGSVDWLDLHVSSSKLPSSEGDAESSGWKVALKDNGLKISWYIRNKDPSLMVAYDGRKNIAGLRINQRKSGVGNDYVGVYTKSGLFETTKIGGKNYFSSTVLFSPPSVLKSGGRRKLASDEVALGVFLKKGGVYEQLDREGCQHSDTGVVEQGCQPQYGLVFSNFDSGSSCDSLNPWYTVWDTQDTGNLIGFGLFTFGQTLPNSKIVSEESLKVLFPERPDCLGVAAQKGVSVVEVWLSKDASEKSSCDNSAESWVELHCDRNMRSMYTIL